ncbi:SasC/FmtB family protein, partial [Staphylococcus epidermidis]
MNLFRKQKFSIRKFNIGIFSALIATVAFLAHPGQATASELEPSQNNDTTAQSDGGLENTSQSNPISEETTNTLSEQTVPSSTENKQTQNDPHHNAQPIAINAEEAESAQTAPYTNIYENNDTSDNGLHVNQPVKHHIEAQSEDVTNHTNSNHSNSSIPENKATTESSSKPKKRGKRSLDTNSGNDATSTTQNTDPNLSNTGPNSINTVITFDDLGIKTSTNRSRPEVKVVDSLNGFTMVNGGKVGLLNSVLERTSVFDSADPKNYQAVDNVVALGRIKGNDPNDHDGFNGIEKEFSVNPNSEIIFSFNTMTAKNRKGGTQLVLRNAENNQEIASTDIQGGGVYRLFKLPDNVHRLKVQFLPMNEIHSDFKRIQQLHDGYRYYSFIDTIGVNSGSHLYVKSRQVNKNVKNGKEFEVNTRIENNGNFAAAIGQNELTYKVTLPDNFEYVDNSTEVSFVNGNVPNSTVNPFSVNFDRQNHTLTFSSNGLNLGRSAQDVARFLPNKILNIRYKLRPVNISTPREVTFNEAIKYKTFSEYYINTTDNTVTGQQTPFSINVIMNKDDLSEQVNKDIIPSNYTLASYNKYNKLKERAQTVLDEETNNTPFNQRYSQTQIDDLLHELQTTLISRVSASREINDKAQEMTDGVYDSTELTTEEKDTLVDQIENHKNEISNNIDDELTDDGVERVKEAGLHTLESDTPHPVTKPNARQVVNNKAEQQKTLIRNNHEATTEEQNEAISQVEAHSSDAIAKIGEAETDTTVNEARDNGTRLIATDIPNPTKKAEAREAVTNSANSKIKDINNNTQATLDERNDAITLVNRSKDEAIQNINTAQGNDDVTEAQNNGTNTIQQVPLTPVKRQNAIATINAKADGQKRLIQANNNATTEEKADAERKVNEALLTATQNISNAPTNRDVDQAQTNQNVDTALTNGIQNIQNIQVDVRKKQEARTTINDIVQQHKQTIQNNDDATTEEKEVANNLVNVSQQNVISKIDNATTNNQIDGIVSDGRQTINAITPDTSIKRNAKNDIDGKAADRKIKIQRINDATAEEIQEANRKIEEAKIEAKDNIQHSSTRDHVNEAKTNGINKIENITPATTVKSEARQAVQNKANEQINHIQNTPDATNEEKQEAINRVSAELARVQAQINAEHTTQGVKNIKDDAITSLSRINAQVVEKESARNAIEQKSTQQTQFINDNENATDEEKEVANNLVIARKQNALDNINSLSSNSDIENAKVTGINEIAKVLPATTVKSKAKKDIDQKLAQQINQIQTHQTATIEEKEAAIQLANQKANEARTAIQNEHNNNGVAQAKSNGIHEIEIVTPDAHKKSDAKQSINDKYNEQSNTINTTPDATDEEKQKALDKLKIAKDTGDRKVDQAQTNQQVSDSKTEAIDTITNIQANVAKKPSARVELDSKFEDLKRQINATPDATEEEKQDAIQRLNVKREEVKNLINQDRRDNDVEQHKNTGLQELETIHANPTRKSDALQELQTKFISQTELINNNKDATNEEKDEAKRLLEISKNKTITNINQAQTNNQVDNAKDNGMNEIATIIPATTIKTDAKTAIDKKAEQQVTIINGNNDATDEEKAEARKLVEKAKTEVKSNITNSDTEREVNSAKTNGLEKINNIQPSTQTKTNAKQEINDKAQEQLIQINNTPDATEEEKQEATNRVNAGLAQAIQNINNAHSTQEVNESKTHSIATIKSILPNVIKKPTAINDLTQEANNQKTLIGNDGNATDDEKEAAKQLVTQKLNEEIQKIHESTQDNQVDNVKAQAITAIKLINANAHKRQDAINILTNLAESKKSDIRANQDATTEEKNTAIQSIDDTLAQARNNINGANTNALVDENLEDGKQKLQRIVLSTQTKTQAKADIAQAIGQQRSTIDQNQNATTEEKQEALERLNQDTNGVNDRIQAALANQNVTDEKNNILETIRNVEPIVVVKPKANEIIRKKAAKQTTLINQNQDATLEEKQIALGKLEEVKNEALNQVSQAHSNNDVKIAENNGIAKISEVHPETSIKRNAKQEIEQVAQSQIDTINANNKSTNEEKSAAIDRVNVAKIDAINNIANATTTQLVNDAKNNGNTSITQILPSTAVKTNALAALATEAKNKNAIIDQTPNATAEEKEEANNKVDGLQEEADANILKAHTTEEVNNIKNQAVQNINAVQVEVIKKQNVKNQLNQFVDNQKKIIENTPDATLEEKAEANRLLQNVLTSASDEIANVDHNNEVDQALDKARPKIEAIVPQVSKKRDALNAIQEAFNSQTQEIQENQEATNEEKTEALNKINQLLNQAKVNIDQAQSNKDVDNAKTRSIQDIEQIQPHPQTKATGRHRLNEKANQQQSTIATHPNSTIEERQEASTKLQEVLKKAIAKIDKGQTNDDVEKTVVNGIAEIENILPATTVKDKAKADVNAEKEQKNIQINSNDEATTEEKLVASDNLNHVVETTNQAIEDAPDTNQVNVEKNKGIGTIRDIQPLVVKKPTAKSKIESAVEKKKTEINQTQNATHDEVREGLNQLNQIHEKAKNDVNQSQTNQQVENAEQNSLDQINNFRPDFSKKRNAVAEIVKAQQNKIDEIEQEFSATQEEKDNALQHLDEQVKEIINSINQANTDNEVDNAKTSGLNN